VALVLGEASFLGFVPITDPDRAREFYVGVLGLSVVAETPWALIVRSGTTTIRLTPVPDLTPQPFTVAGWGVSDVPATARALRDAGIEANRYDAVDQDELGVWTAPNGDQVVWFCDPDGNTLSVSGQSR